MQNASSSRAADLNPLKSLLRKLRFSVLGKVQNFSCKGFIFRLRDSFATGSYSKKGFFLAKLQDASTLFFVISVDGMCVR